MCDDFAVTEFNQSYEVARRYANAQQDTFKTFLTVHLAVWGGYILMLTNSLEHLTDFLLLFGFFAGLLFMAILTSNRIYFVVSLRRMDYLRRRFLFKNPEDWRDYPGYYVGDASGNKERENHKVFRWHSASVLRLALIAFGNSVLLYRTQTAYAVFGVEPYNLSLAVVFFLVLMIMSFVFSILKERAVTGAGLDKKSVERK